MDLGKKIKEKRNELGLTLEEIGDSVGVSKSTVMKWETGYIENTRKDKIVLLAKALKVSPLWILGLEEDEQYKNAISIPVYGSIQRKRIDDFALINLNYFCLSVANRTLLTNIVVLKVTKVNQIKTNNFDEFLTG